MDKKFVEAVPTDPGVYFFKIEKKPIYIGKALNLKRRVGSYFDLHLEPKTQKMISEANDFSYIVVNSEFEALLLEAKLIRENKPKYNFVLKDDKHPLYITITKEEFPRVITARKSGDYGPFLNSRDVFQVLRMIRRIFPFSDHKIGKRPCIYSHMGLCYPCPNEITTSEQKRRYLRNIRNVKAILNGKIDILKKDLDREMKQLSNDQEYEEAKHVRDQIQKLETITTQRISSSQYLENPNLITDLRSLELKSLSKIIKVKKLNRIECYDIAHLACVSATASMVVFTNGVADSSEYRHFKIKQKKSQSDYDSLREVAIRRLKNTWPRPDLIIVDGGVGQVNIFKGVIKNIPIVGIAKNPDRLVIDSSQKIKLLGPALSLIQRIRNEAHRFARRYHHKLILTSLIP